MRLQKFLIGNWQAKGRNRHRAKSVTAFLGGKMVTAQAA